MSTALKAGIENTYAGIPSSGTTAAAIAATAKLRAQAVLYLAAVAPEYQVVQ